MRIGIFADGYEAVDGVSRTIRILKNGFEAKGHETHLFVPAKKGEREGRVYKFGGMEVPTSPDYTLAFPNPFEVVKICKKFKINLIHSHTPFTMGYTSLFVKNTLNLKGVGTFHTMMPEYPHYMWAEYPVVRPIWKYLAWEYLSLFYNRFEVLTCPSKSTQKILKKHGISAMVVPNGIDIHKFSPQVNPDGFIKKYKLQGKKVILSVGRIDREKRFDVLMDTARLIDDPEYIFVVVGKGNELQNYSKLKPKNMIFTGFLPDDLLQAAYASALCFVNCSMTETQGLTFLESMATGVPVIAADCRVNRETVGSGGAFFRSTEELVQMIKEMSDTKIRNKYSKKARKIAEGNSIEIMIERYLKIFEGLQ